MPRALWLPDQLQKYGLVVNLVSGWETRGSSSFGPECVVVHHDAIAGGNTAGLNVVINGRKDLAGPLANVYLARNGIAFIVASGRANHAGEGSWRGVRGNAKALGIEAANNGVGEPWPLCQLDAYYRMVAAMLEYLGRDEGWACGHKEWRSSKPDPYGIDMNEFRSKVKYFLDTGGNIAPVPEPKEIVKPMFNPPLDLEPIVAECKAPNGGVWLLARSGAVYAFGGASYAGSPFGKSYFAGRKAASIESGHPVGKVYIITSSQGERYAYPE
jgi:hypothetical protein